MSQAITQPVENEERVGRSLWGDAVVRIRRDYVAMLCLTIIIIYTVVAITAGIIYSDWSKECDYNNRNQPPSAVTNTRLWASSIRSANASTLKPP